MSLRLPLIELLNAYDSDDVHQMMTKTKIEKFVEENAQCFLRASLQGHITGSCWLVSPDRKNVLLTHHKKIGRWIQLGGHADGDPDLLRVAVREAEEESGIRDIRPISRAIFDLDIHVVEEYQGVPQHFHYDIRFALMAPHLNYAVSGESHDLAWVSIEKLMADSDNPSLFRMARKWHKSALSRQRELGISILT